jgi:hypothetical protein
MLFHIITAQVDVEKAFSLMSERDYRLSRTKLPSSPYIYIESLLMLLRAITCALSVKYYFLRRLSV